MKTATISSRNRKRPSGPVFKVRQAVVALGLDQADEVILSYLDFLAGQIPVDHASFLHVLPRFDLFNALYEREQEGLISNYELNEEVIGRMRDKIHRRMKTIRTTNIRFEVREGNPLEELVKETEQRNADLIVIGQKAGVTHHSILARNLVRESKGNALIIPEFTQNKLRDILVPIDFSPYSAKALHMALAIRRQSGNAVRIVCLNVYDLPNFSVYRIQKTREELKHMLEEDRRQAFQAFLQTEAPDDAADIQTVLIDREQPGIPSYILNFAENHDIDLIIMGAKGHSKVELLLLGSVTEKLLTANERIPTLVVKDPTP